MKPIIQSISVCIAALVFSSCSTTTVVKPEPVTVTESIRRTSSSHSTGGMAPAVSSSTESRSVTAQ